MNSETFEDLAGSNKNILKHEFLKSFNTEMWEIDLFEAELKQA